MHLLDHDVVELLIVQQQRDLVDAVDVDGGNYRAFLDVGEQRNLAPLGRRQRPVGPAQQDIRLDTDGAQFLDRVLRRLGLDLAGGGDIGHQRQVHEQRALVAELDAHLANRLQERQRLDVTDRAADLDHGDIGIVRTLADAVLDLVGDVRDDLHGGAEVIAAPLLADHAFVDLAGGEIVVLRHGGADEALVVPEVEVGFRAVVGDEHLAVLERAHGARIDIDVGIELQQRHLETAGLQQCAQRGRCDAFAQ